MVKTVINRLTEDINIAVTTKLANIFNDSIIEAQDAQPKMLPGSDPTGQSPNAASIYDNAVFDPLTGRWRLIDRMGYARLYEDKPSPKNWLKYDYEHRRVMEEMIGRPLEVEEIIHHLDGNRSNNAKENLELLKDHLEHIRTKHPEWRKGLTGREKLAAISDIDLDKYLKMYDSFDAAHNVDHANHVSRQAKLLAERYLPSKVDLAGLAGHLHDIGIADGREKHEMTGARRIWTDSDLRSKLYSGDFNDLAHSVAEHRASTGNPRTTLAKIVSDADRTPLVPPIERAYLYGLKNMPELTPDQQIWRAAEYVTKKFGPGGTGTRFYFPETGLSLEKMMEPTIRAFNSRDFNALKRILKLK